MNYSVLKEGKIHQYAKFLVIPSMRSPGNARKPQIWPVSLSQNCAKIIKSTNRGHKLIIPEGGQDTSACKTSGHFLHAFSRKCPETRNLTRFTRSKSTDHGHKPLSSENGQDTSACKISGHSLHAFSGKCPETSPDGRTDRRMDGRTCRKMVTVGRVDQWTHVQVKRVYFRLRTDGRNTAV